MYMVSGKNIEIKGLSQQMEICTECQTLLLVISGLQYLGLAAGVDFQ